MTNCQCEGIEREFDAVFAEKELRRFRRAGARKTTRMLLDALRNGSLEVMTLLDVGGGIGAIQLELLRRGLARAVSVDASSGFQDAARREALNQGVADRIEYAHGDFVQLASTLPEADIVTLDRVICCYDDMPALVQAAARKARRRCGFVYPRRAWWTKAGVRAANLWFKLRGSPMRSYVHAPEDVDRLLRQDGFQLISHRKTAFWRVDVYSR